MIGTYNVLHRYLVSEIEFPPYQLAPMAFRRVRLATHNRNSTTFGIRIHQPAQPGPKIRHHRHLAIIKISLIVITRFALRTPTNAISHINISYPFFLQHTLNQALVELLSPP